jgi:2-polyprenyl-6-methoxyphenol hydroxylase-like FAD-dependent oxidoreductase
MTTVLIAGGGVGGLTLALKLHAARLRPLLFEAVESVRPLGVGINLLPHAVEHLETLGLLPALDDIAIRTSTLRYLTAQGQQIWAEPRGLAAGHNAPQFSIHRGRLQKMLWDAAAARLPAAALRPGHRLAGYEQDAQGVRARFAREDGSLVEVQGDVLVGADGIHSGLRAQLHPQDPGIRWNGISMWRGAAEWPAFEGGDTMVVAGDAVAKLVLYPIAPGSNAGARLTNWVIYARTAAAGAPLPARESWSRQADPAIFSDYSARLALPFIDALALIGATEAVYEYPMCDRDPLPWWTDRRVTLLGDAAHPMYPVGSNGGSQAILDAAMLAKALTEMPPTAALAAYEAERRPKTAEIVRSNRKGGPEQVIDLAAARAPHGFAKIEDIASHEELSGIVKGYAILAGFALKGALDA